MPPLKPYEVVFLDADETLFDFRRAEKWALAQAFGTRGLELGEKREAAYGDLYAACLAKASFLLPGAEELCARLASGRRLAIVTNGIAEVQRTRLASSPIARYIEALVVSEEVGSSKPDPGIFEAACERVGHRDKSRILMVGDSLALDIKGGIAFGVDTCWYNPRGLPGDPAVAPSYEARNFDEVAAIAEGR